MNESGKIFAKLARALQGETWLQTARPSQLPPDGDWFIWLHGRPWLWQNESCGRMGSLDG
jgi:hypothetical protein